MWNGTAGMKREEKEGSPPPPCPALYGKCPLPMARKQHPFKGLGGGQQGGPQDSKTHMQALGEGSDMTGKLLEGQLRSQFETTLR